MKKYTFEDYIEKLKIDNPVLKEKVLAHAAENNDIDLDGYAYLCELAYPDPA